MHVVTKPKEVELFRHPFLEGLQIISLCSIPLIVSKSSSCPPLVCKIVANLDHLGHPQVSRISAQRRNANMPILDLTSVTASAGYDTNQTPMQIKKSEAPHSAYFAHFITSWKRDPLSSETGKPSRCQIFESEFRQCLVVWVPLQK